MAKTIQKLIMSLFVLLGKYLEDIFIVGGLAVLIGTTYYVSYTAGNYSLGAVFIMLGLILARRG